jgi:hypothetical protein
MIYLSDLLIVNVDLFIFDKLLKDYMDIIETNQKLIA